MVKNEGNPIFRTKKIKSEQRTKIAQNQKRSKECKKVRQCPFLVLPPIVLCIYSMHVLYACARSFCLNVTISQLIYVLWTSDHAQL